VYYNAVYNLMPCDKS